MAQLENLRAARPTGEAGIAIGPILFIIAVLGILAAAISAGSGSFNASSTAESNRTKAAAIIEIGQNLKWGFDRITASGGIDFANVVIGTANTANTTDLFSPTGGGIGIPSGALAVLATYQWSYPEGAVPNVGTGSDPDQLAMLDVSNGVCQEINNKLLGNPTPNGSTIATGADLGSLWGGGGPGPPAMSPRSVITNIAVNWPTAFNGQSTGCVYSTGNQKPGWYFYQVIGIQ